MVRDCQRLIRLDKGTASFRKATEYQKMKVAGLEVSEDDDTDVEDSASSESDKSSSSSERSSSSEEEYEDNEERELEQELQEEGNWWDSPEEPD